ncbi:MAG: A/G-specific adenine glycosylase [Alphaproteobacteria bacterium]|nr:A/G-specific adenine glycosylase [Alphaproteobacteria bacterium]
MAVSKSKLHHSALELTPQKRTALVKRLLDWYDTHRRRLPWRALPGETPDPYRVWLSEIMLQQTTVATVGPYFHNFLKRWPTMKALAAAPVEEVMSAWAGLGYYSRARNLHACAQVVAERHAGKLPADEAELQKLPGIGPYTAAAIAAIAFDKRAAPVDGNIERVLARLFAIKTALPTAKPELRAIAETFAPAKRSGDFAQAMMDLGATICTPKSPACGNCPWADDCDARALGIAASLPARETKPDRPLRRGIAFVLISERDEVLLRRRPPKGLLGGMHEPPMSPWGQHFPAEPLMLAPIKTKYRKLPGLVRHGFTHFELELEVYRAENLPRGKANGAGEWAPITDLARFALPSVMRKVIEHALADRDAGLLFGAPARARFSSV